MSKYNTHRPELICPSEENNKWKGKGIRYALGRAGSKPLAVIGMNPSTANMKDSDSTVNRVIKKMKDSELDGWFMFNLFPVREKYPEKLKKMKRDNSVDKLLKDNFESIKKYITSYGIKDVIFAWGDLKPNILKESKKYFLKEFYSFILKHPDIKLYIMADFTKKGEPIHFMNRIYNDDKRILIPVRIELVDDDYKLVIDN